jgi:hypothetical protein
MFHNIQFELLMANVKIKNSYFNDLQHITVK